MLDLRTVWTCWLLWSLTNNAELPSLCPDAASLAWWDWLVCLFVLFCFQHQVVSWTRGDTADQEKEAAPND